MIDKKYDFIGNAKIFYGSMDEIREKLHKMPEKEAMECYMLMKTACEQYLKLADLMTSIYVDFSKTKAIVEKLKEAKK